MSRIQGSSIRGSSLHGSSLNANTAGAFRSMTASTTGSTNSSGIYSAFVRTNDAGFQHYFKTMASVMGLLAEIRSGVHDPHVMARGAREDVFAWRKNCEEYLKQRGITPVIRMDDGRVNY